MSKLAGPFLSNLAFDLMGKSELVERASFPEIIFAAAGAAGF
jgi:hypothetical protein